MTPDSQRSEQPAREHDDAAADWPLISFVIPVRNDRHRLRSCLESIARNDYPGPIEVMVVDNGSTDGSGDVARDSGVRVLRIPDARVGALRNRGAEIARGAVLAFVDADHEIDSAWARNAVETLRSSGAAAVGAPYQSPPNGTWVQGMYDLFRHRRPGCADVEWLGSGNLAVQRGEFEQLGGFAETLESCEDVEFCQRLRAGGRRLMSCDRLKSVHFGDPSTLRELFVGELWRGRDNFRMSVRGPISLRGLPSLAIPLIDLGLLLAGVLGVLLTPVGGLRLTALAICGIGAVALLRMARMLFPKRTWRVGDVPKAFAVAYVYELARALALVTRAGHRRRHGSRDPVSAVEQPSR